MWAFAMPGWCRYSVLRRLAVFSCDYEERKTLCDEEKKQQRDSESPTAATANALSGTEWFEALQLNDKQRVQAIAERLTQDRVPEVARVLLSSTVPSDRVLEVGSGTGEVSLFLAKAGRRVTLLDIHPRSLEFALDCAFTAGLKIEVVCADATMPLPFKDNSFDCAWSSGLLEHFETYLQEKIIRECKRVASKNVISFVPNASCVAYRLGKLIQERNGTWMWGLETPMSTLRPVFESSGLCDVDEKTIGYKWALEFLPKWYPVYNSLSRWLDRLSPAELDSTRQGYLLVTSGKVLPPG